MTDIDNALSVNPDDSRGETLDYMRGWNAALASMSPRMVSTVEEPEWEYCRVVGGFGWPQGYPQPVGADESPTHRRRPRTNAIPAGPWEPFTPDKRNKQ